MLTEFFYKIREIYGWVRYFFTRKKYELEMSDQVLEFLDSLSEEDKKIVLKEFDSLSKNPYKGRSIDIKECE